MPAQPESQELKVTERDTTLTPRQLRAAGFIPATIVGATGESQSLQVKAHSFSQLYAQGVREFHLTGFITATVKVQQLQMEKPSQNVLSIQFQRLDQTVKAAKSKNAKTEKPAAKPEEPQPETEAALSGV